MQAAKDKTLVYLHGFMGSSQSLKARQTAEWMSGHFPRLPLLVPDLPIEPAQVLLTVEKIIADCNAPVFIGSSMGGFYANYFAERLGARAVMINPAVYPHRLLQRYVGVQQSPYTGQQFEFHESYLEQLQETLVKRMQRPEQRMVLLQTGDETLDYREAEAYYRGARCIVEVGGDHAFVNYPRHLPEVAEFLLQ